MMIPFQKIYLASASPRRLSILQNLGLEVEVCAADIDETPYPIENALDYVERMAREKNHAAVQKNPQANAPILSADTTVALNGQILGKPQSEDEARTMLRSLSGSTHQVLTAVCLSYLGQEFCLVQSSDVQFKSLTEQEISDYIATGEPMDKAGAYGIQGLGGLFVAHLSGSFTGVMGLPVYETAILLRDCANLV